MALNQLRPNKTKKSVFYMFSLLHRLPEILRVKESREFRVDIDNMDITFLDVSNDGLVIVARVVSLDIDAQRSKNFEFETMSSD